MVRQNKTINLSFFKARVDIGSVELLGPIIGTNRDDDLEGTDANDTIEGRGGDDLLRGLDGDDLLDGSSGDDSLLGGKDRDNLKGGEGNDLLDGGGGEDRLRGGEGNDMYIVNNEGDSPEEKAKNGRDTIIASLDWSLNDNIENLIMENGSSRGTGNDLDNRILGNDDRNRLRGKDGDDSLSGGDKRDRLLGDRGNDVLVGGAGDDNLKGGSGDDQFLFNSPNQGVDTIADFSSGRDAIAVELSGFGSGLSRGTLSESQFTLSNQDVTEDTRFIYTSRTGTLSFDPDGSGDSRATDLLVLTDSPRLSFSDILVF